MYRHLAATKLARVLEDISEKNDSGSWSRLFKFSRRCLAVPRRGGRRRNLASTVNTQLQEEAEPPSNISPHSRFKRRPSNGQADGDLRGLAKRVSSKLEDGDYRGTVRIACSEDTVVELSDDILSALRMKHPSLHPESVFPSPPNLVDFCPLPSISEDIIVQAVHSFPRGSSAGPDGIRPQHLLDLVSPTAERGGKELLHALAVFINHVLSGNVPPAVQPIFFGATLIPLRKKEGGVRPITVGQILRRLVAKCIGLHVIHSVGGSLSPLQVGCGVPLGCEAAAHAARIYLKNIPSDHILMKFDFQNAFNSLRRDKMLNAVKNVVPEIFEFVSSAYARPSFLFCGDHTLLSSEGAQQGDPLGPLLFCITIHPLIQGLRSDFSVFYLNDGTIGGSRDDVLADLQLMEDEAATLGLKLNRSKTELVSSNVVVQNSILSIVSDLKVVPCSQVSLLGTPIGSLELLDSTIEAKTQRLQLMGKRLSGLRNQDALCLLRHSFAIPKVLFILRSAPCFLSNKLEAFDRLLRSLLSIILNINLDHDGSWLHAGTLPVHDGDLGVRRAAQLAPSAFLASAAGCSSLILEILPPCLHACVDPHIELALTAWRQNHSESPPSLPESSHQRVWVAPLVAATITSLLDGAPSEQVTPRLLAASTPESGAWLNVLPIPSLGLQMDDDVVRIAAGVSLGVAICHPHQCRSCGADVDSLGTHGLSCHFSSGRHCRHAAVNDIVKRSLDSARIPSYLEPSGLF